MPTHRGLERGYLREEKGTDGVSTETEVTRRNESRLFPCRLSPKTEPSPGPTDTQARSEWALHDRRRPSRTSSRIPPRLPLLPVAPPDTPGTTVLGTHRNRGTLRPDPSPQTTTVTPTTRRPSTEVISVLPIAIDHDKSYPWVSCLPPLWDSCPHVSVHGSRRSLRNGLSPGPVRRGFDP